MCYKNVWFLWIYKMFSNTFLSNFLLLLSFFALAGKNYIHASCFSFFLVNSKCDVYIPVDNGLVYSYPKMFLLISSLKLSLVYKTIFLDSHLDVFCSWIKLVVEFGFCHWFSLACKSCFSIMIHFDFKMNADPYLSVIICLCLFANTNYTSGWYRSLPFAGMLLFCFYPWPYLLNILIFSRESVDVFGIAAYDVFSKLFWKICPLFGQILVTLFKVFQGLFFAFLL